MREKVVSMYDCMMKYDEDKILRNKLADKERREPCLFNLGPQILYQIRHLDDQRISVITSTCALLLILYYLFITKNRIQ